MSVSGKELMIICAIYLFCEQLQGITIDQSDLTIQEGSSKDVPIRRSGSLPVNITVFVATIEDYRRFEQAASDNECSVTLSRLLNGSEVDPAEADDLLVREYTLIYGMEEREKSITLEVTDDDIAENEETFILYTNFMEALNDRCAITVRLQDNDMVKFNFSRANLSIRESEDLPSLISIIKTGQNEPIISFQVFVYPVEGGPDETDFIAHSDHLYVFTNEISELPIETELVEDLLAEDDEVIVICLPHLQEYSLAEPADPNCVRVTINDDDPVVIGFSDSNTSVVLTEGAPFSPICISIKQGGFPLHPRGNLELTIQTESIDGEVKYGNERLEFDSTHMTSCKLVAARNDHTSDGTHTSMLTIGMPDWSSVPVIMSPGRIPITVLDTDVISFELLTSNTDGVQGASETPPMVQEGVRVDNLIKIQKRGYTKFAYIVLLSIQLLTESEDSLDAGVTINTTVRFQGSTSQLGIVNIPIDVLDDSMTEKQRQFIVSILRIQILNTKFSTGSTTGARTAIDGGPVRITIYDNDFIIGLVNKSDDAAVPGGSLTICVAILDPKPPDIDPTRRIPIEILVSTANTATESESDVVQLEMNEVVLSALNTQVCIVAVIQAECKDIRNLTFELNWSNDPMYDVNFQQRTLSITCQQQQGVEGTGGVSPMTPTGPDGTTIIIIIVLVVVIAAVVVMLILIIILVLCTIKLCARRKRKKKYMMKLRQEV